MMPLSNSRGSSTIPTKKELRENLVGRFIDWYT